MARAKHCRLPFCEREVYARDLCVNHYMASHRWGFPLPRNDQDLRWLYRSFAQAHALIRRYLAENPMYVFADGWFRCMGCGNSAKSVEYLYHDKDCLPHQMSQLVKRDLPPEDQAFPPPWEEVMERMDVLQDDEQPFLD